MNLSYVIRQLDSLKLKFLSLAEWNATSTASWVFLFYIVVTRFLNPSTRLNYPDYKTPLPSKAQLILIF
jgi:hypothetical protein